MEWIGRIEPQSGSRLDKDEWVRLIETHPGLAPVPREGVNPFTQKPHFYKAPPTCARVLSANDEIGSITWAEDDSILLDIWALSDERVGLLAIAQEVADLLGCRLVTEKNYIA